MYKVNLKGSYYEIGAKYGAGMKETGFKTPEFSAKQMKLGRECRDLVETVFPEILEEIQGIAQSSGISYDSLSTMLLTLALADQQPPNCTIFAVKEGDQVWMGRNYDWFYRSKEYTESYFTSPEGGHRSLGHSDIFVGREDGVNEKGLGVAMSGITEYFQPGVNFWIAIRYILDKCSTVDEGVKFLQETPPHCTITVLLADPTGKMAVVETSPMRTEVRWSEEDFLVSTNHFNHPEMVKIKMYEPPDSRIRYNTVVDRLRSRTRLDYGFIKSILSDHKGLVCSHRDDIGLGTLWSTVTHLNTLRLWRAEGHPCVDPYIEDERLISAVKKGAEP
jgi:predicted choloylglycine hydrolase